MVNMDAGESVAWGDASLEDVLAGLTLATCVAPAKQHLRCTFQSLFKMFLDREQINHLSSRTPAKRAEGSACCDGTGQNQIPPWAAPAFGMTELFRNLRF